MTSELARELAEFPFSKLKPRSFHLKIASLTGDLLAKLPVRIWVETANIPEVVQVAGSAHVIRTYPHLDPSLIEQHEMTVALQDSASHWSPRRT